MLLLLLVESLDSLAVTRLMSGCVLLIYRDLITSRVNSGLGPLIKNNCTLSRVHLIADGGPNETVKESV